ncbi:hypothetical protein D3C87_1953290 [compost metagenome]
MAVDATIHHQAGGDDAGVAARLGQQFGVQRNFKSAADFKKVDVRRLIALSDHLADKTFTALINDFLVPARLDKRYALALMVFAFAIDCGGLHLF